MVEAKRDSKGRFLPGSKASPGRPRGSTNLTKRDYLSALVEEVPIERWRKLVQKALADAVEGNSEARRWLAEYLIGKPPTILELRASEAALLRELLNHFEQQGVAASDVFNAMLASLIPAALDENGSTDNDDT